MTNDKLNTPEAVNETDATSQELVCNTSSCDPKALPRVAPRQRVHETENGWLLEVELPGVAAEDVQLEVEQRMLTLEAVPAPLPQLDGARPLRREFTRTAFAQRWRLPAKADLDSVQTSYRHGLLSIELPYRAPERRRIDVQVN